MSTGLGFPNLICKSLERLTTDANKIVCLKMADKLPKFYLNCVVPRRRRFLAIRNPDYIFQAERERKKIVPAAIEASSAN